MKGEEASSPQEWTIS